MYLYCMYLYIILFILLSYAHENLHLIAFTFTLNNNIIASIHISAIPCKMFNFMQAYVL